jgi:two-component system OmpR family sensor kinase
MIVIVGVAMVASFRAGSQLNNSLNAAPVYELIDEAGAVLEANGIEGLLVWLKDAENFPAGITLYVLDESAVDILGRDFPGFLWPRSQARERITSWATSQTFRPTLTGPDGLRYMPIVGPAAQPRLGALGAPGIQWVVFLAAMVASGLACFLLTRFMTKRLTQLASAADSLSQGKLETRVNIDTNDEIGIVARQFDRLAETIQRQIESRQEFFRNVSHEMRSPLARIKLAIELAELDPETAKEQLHRIRGETAHLEKMMSQILDLAKLEDPDRDDSFEVVDLVEIIDIVVSDARFEGEARGQRVEWQAPDTEYPVLAHIDLLRSAIENVLRNAIKHTARGTVVTIGLKLVDGKALLEIQDSGQGVVGEHLEDIFKPFYRGASGKTKGAGIGLAISRQAMGLMNGSIRAAKAPGSGLRVSLSLPLTTEPAAIPA